MTLNQEAFAKALAAGIAAYDDAVRGMVAGAEGWIEWAGGECPLEDEPVAVILRDGREMESSCANYLYWDNSGTYRDIVAYRLAK